MPGFGEKLKRAFVTTASPPSSAARQPSAGVATIAPSAMPATIAGSADAIMVKRIMDQVLGQDAPVLKAFQDNLRRLEAGIPDERTRIIAAAATIANSNPVDVIQAMQARLTALEAERKKFQSDRDVALRDTVQSKDSTIAGLDQQIATKQTELQQLIAGHQAAITSLSQQKQEAQTARQAAQAEIDRQAVVFGASFSEVQTKIQSEVARITGYLQGGTS